MFDVQSLSVSVYGDNQEEVIESDAVPVTSDGGILFMKNFKMNKEK